jgi:hypothetical protein
MKALDALHDVVHGINPAIKKKAERCAETLDYLLHEYLERHAKVKKRSWREDGRIIRRTYCPAWAERSCECPSATAPEQ